MKSIILDLMKQKSYHALDTYGLYKRLGKSNNVSFQVFTKALYELEKDGLVVKNKKGMIDLTENMGYKIGVLDLKQAGYGFIKLEDQNHPDIFIPASKTNSAMDKDTCMVKISKEKYGNRFEGEIVKVVKRNFDVITGEYFQGAVFIKSNPQNIIFKVKKNQELSLKDHTLVKAKVLRTTSSFSFEVSVIEVLGEMNDPNIDLIEVVSAYDLRTEFPEEVLLQARSIPSEIQTNQKTTRRDLRNDIIFTIDGDDTRDIDDAISIKLIENGLYLLGVHIADVSYYVTKNSPLDQEAYLRGTSVYFPNQVIPMLPKELSNGICSLNPQVDRYTITCSMEITKQGEVVNYEIYPSIIKSRYQMTYKNVNKILEGDNILSQKYNDIVPSITTMNDLAHILHHIRTKKGSINFETIEPKILFNDKGGVSDILIRERGVSEGIIEEFMLVANQVIASHFDNAELPFIYRIHELPDSDKLENLFALAKELHYIPHIPNPITHHDLQALLAKVENTKYEKVINTLMLRSMAKAKYSEENIGHYGLAFDDYTHFTSPIRRYPDLIVHRYIRDYLFLEKVDVISINEKIEELPNIAKQTSLTERNAMLAEREVVDIKKAEYMESHLLETFEGVISALTRFGMFVELPNTVEGLVHISTFKEAVEFIEDKMIYLGISSRIEYTIGTVVTIKVVNVSKSLGRIDFELV